VEAGIIAGGAAVSASVVTSLLAVRITRIQALAAARAARASFMAARQADLYVELGELAERMRAAAGVAAELALGKTPVHPAPPPVSDERWYAFQGTLRVFGSRVARDTFGDLQAALKALQFLAAHAQSGQLAAEQDVAAALDAASGAMARIRTIASAEVGPLRDLLVLSTRHSCQLRWRSRGRMTLNSSGAKSCDEAS